MGDARTILILCRNPLTGERVRSTVSGHYKAATADTAEEALELARTQAPALIVCDDIRQMASMASLPAIVLAPYDANSGAAFDQLVCNYLPEPFTGEELLSLVGSRLAFRPGGKATNPVEVERDSALWILDRLDEGVIRLDENWRFTYLNASAERLLGFSRRELLGEDHWRMFPAVAGSALEREYRRAVESGEPVEFENWYEPWRRWFKLKAHPSNEGLTVFFADITDRKGLVQIQERLAAIVESSEDAIIGKDLDGVVRSWNEAAERIFGYTAEEMIGQPIAKLAAPGAEQEIRDNLERIRRGERVEHYDTQRRTKNGETLTVSLTISPIRGASGEIIGASKIARDVTGRRRAEALLLESRQRLSAIYDGTNEYIFLLAPDGTLLEANRAALEFAGNSRDEVVGRPFHEGPWFARTPATAELVKQAVALAAAGECARFEAILQRPGGESATFDISFHPVTGEDGRVVLIVPEGREITERKKAEEALKISEDSLRQALDSMPQLVWSASAAGERELFNRQWLDYTGLSLEESLGEGFEGVIHPDDRAETMERWRQSLAGGAAFEAEFRCRRHDGEYRWFLARANPIRDEGGATIRWLATNTDIDDHKGLERKLLRANDDLEQFAYAASHDLQEPLRAFSIYTELLETRYKDRLDGQAMEFIGYLKRAAARMEELIRGLLTYTQLIDVGQHHRPEITDANTALRAAEADISELMELNGAEVISESLPSLPVRRVHLVEIFRNLIENAIRTRRESRPEIRIAAEENDGGWLFSVKDNGKGVEPQYKERVFGLFKRLHGTDAYPGSGIGLAVCRRIVQKYGGRIDVDSEPGHGSVFRFTLPRP